MERQQGAATRGRRKTPSFSSSLLDAIYHSIDGKEGGHHRRNNAAHVEEEIESLRRTIMVEKWMENYASRHHLSASNSGASSSTDSSAFSSSETDSSSAAHKPKKPADTSTPKREGRFTRTKSRAMKIYGDLKKVKEPSSPGGRFTSFLNSIFSPRINVKKTGSDDNFRHVRKSRSMKDTTTTTTTIAATASSASCLSKNRSTGTAKSTRSVRFCPVSVILDEDSRPCGHKNTYENDVVIGSSHLVKKNLNSFVKVNQRRHELRNFYDDNDSDLDDRSCASSDLFELENIGRVGMYEQELPVYGTTSVEMNHAIANRQNFLT